MREDKIGSYETIGRLVFKTCEDYVEDTIMTETRNMSHPTFFSILNYFQEVLSFNDTNIRLQRSHSEIIPRIIDSTNEDFMDSLIEASESLFREISEWDFQYNKGTFFANMDCNHENFNEIFSMCSLSDKGTQTIKTKTICSFLNSVLSCLIRHISKLKH